MNKSADWQVGSGIHIHMQFSVMDGHKANWDLVLVSLVDITARKKAEAYLEYLGKHDALTKLNNRAFYTEELLRPDLIPTQGPKLFEVEYGGASHSNSGGAHACQ